MNSTINKQKSGGSIITHITVNRLKITNEQEITDNFAKFYANVGANLASVIKQGKKDIGGYLENIPKVINRVRLRDITREEIDQNIDALPNKTSSWCDNISRVFLKKMKETEVVPLCKNKDIAK